MCASFLFKKPECGNQVSVLETNSREHWATWWPLTEAPPWLLNCDGQMRSGWGLKVVLTAPPPPPLVFHAHTNPILSLDRSSIFLITCCIRSSSSSSLLPLREEVATSPDKWKLRHASLVISWWTCGCFEEHVSFGDHFLQHGADSTNLISQT